MSERIGKKISIVGFCWGCWEIWWIWKVLSNAKSGAGYSDSTVEVEDDEVGIVIELKCAENTRFDAVCRKALKQISDRQYEEALVDDGMKTIYRYGIAC